MNIFENNAGTKKKILSKQCQKCKNINSIDFFSPTKSFFFPDGYLPICNDCIKELLIEREFNWADVDKLCQCADIPFVPNEFERLREQSGDDVFPIYAKVFLSTEYDGLGWTQYFEDFKNLKEVGLIEEELPKIKEEKYKKLKIKWGANYDDFDLTYLEGLYEGMMSSQNINGTLQEDQALKLCKISLSIDSSIREGRDFDKLLGSYDKLIKIAEFTPKNTKNASDFESCGELCRWLEKRGWKNNFFDDVTRDIVDETMKNVQNFNQRLYTNEPGIGEEINKRIEALKYAEDKDLMFLEGAKSYDLDSYDNDGFEKLLKDEEFSAEIDGGD